MATTEFSTFATEILPFCPGVPPPLVNTVVRQSATEFCRDTGTWVETLTAIDSVVDQDEYTITSNDSVNGLVRTIETVHYDGLMIGNQEYNSLLALYPTHPDTDSSGTPYKWSMIDRDTMTLFPVPDTAVTGGIVVRCTVIPKKAATGLDSNVAEDYEEAIVNGAIFRLLNMPDKSWSDGGLAQYYGRKFRSGMAQARARMVKGYAETSQQVAFPKVVGTSISIRRVI